MSIPVAKTALDSINAKVSAIHSNYDPITKYHNNNGEELYAQLLRSMQYALGHADYYEDTARPQKVKRQTPLVNAGYAIRIEALTSTLTRFVHENKDRKTGIATVNVVLLGCGLDVMGLWATSLASDEDSGGTDIQVYEVDMEQNVMLKKDVLSKVSLFTQCSTENGDDQNEVGNSQKSKGIDNRNRAVTNNDIIINGRIDCSRLRGEAEATIGSKNDQQMARRSNNYTLMAADLRDISSLQKAIQASSFNPDYPTIVISELVLAYLGTHTDDLLKYIASSLCTCPSSLFLAYEPVGTCTKMNCGNTDTAIISVMDGYTNDYFDQFASKLDRGNASIGTETSSKGTSFHPVGLSNVHVIEKLRQCRFDGVADCSPMTIAAKHFEISRRHPPELFDEQAAFYMHLSCYSIICATTLGTSLAFAPSSSDAAAYGRCCPWINLDIAARGSGYEFKNIIPKRSKDMLRKMTGEDPTTETNMILQSLQTRYQEQVRNLFRETYTHLFDEYPSVKKMVKSALKTDLSTKGKGCAIWNTYSKEGGAFWIVTNDVGTTDRIDASEGYVIGCVGVKKCSFAAGAVAGTLESYEVNRLAVKAEWRGRRIGKILLDTVETFICNRELIRRTRRRINSKSNSIGIIARTPKVLEAANVLYSSQGFHVQEEALVGKMTMRVFLKELNVAR